MTVRRVMAAMLILALASCGRSTPLRPRSGASLPAPAYGHSERPTAATLLIPTPEQRPGVSDELLQRSQVRTADPFALAPGEAPPPLPAQPDAATGQAATKPPPATQGAAGTPSSPH